MFYHLLLEHLSKNLDIKYLDSNLKAVKAFPNNQTKIHKIIYKLNSKKSSKLTIKCLEVDFKIKVYNFLTILDNE